MADDKSVSYTLRAVPWPVWKQIRTIATDERQTVEQTVLDALVAFVKQRGGRKA